LLSFVAVVESKKEIELELELEKNWIWNCNMECVFSTILSNAKRQCGKQTPISSGKHSPKTFSNSDILGASSRVATPIDLDLAFGAVDVTDGLSCTSLLSPLSPLPPPIASPPSSAAAGEPSPSEIQEFSLS